jgi:hypothetical protein
VEWSPTTRVSSVGICAFVEQQGNDLTVLCSSRPIYWSLAALQMSKGKGNDGREGEGEGEGEGERGGYIVREVWVGSVVKKDSDGR